MSEGKKFISEEKDKKYGEKYFYSPFYSPTFASH